MGVSAEKPVPARVAAMQAASVRVICPAPDRRRGWPISARSRRSCWPIADWVRPGAVAATVISGIGKIYDTASPEQAGLIFDPLPLGERFPVGCDHLRGECGATVHARALGAEQKPDAAGLRCCKPGPCPG